MAATDSTLACRTCGRRLPQVLLEFTLPGPPLSGQARKEPLRLWKEAVRAAAKSALPAVHEALIQPIALRATYYYSSTAPDVDNMLKPIQDALNGVVYRDDRQIMDSTGRKRAIVGAFRVIGRSTTLLAAFGSGTEFVHVEILVADLEEIG